MRRHGAGLTPRRLRLVVAPSEQGTSLTALLSGRGGLPAQVAREVLASGRVRVNGRPAKSDVALAVRDEVLAHVLARSPASPTFDEARVLLSDEHVLVVDKPSGIPTQGTEKDALSGLDSLLHQWLVTRGERRPLVGVVHRLDVETSGVIVFGRSDVAIRSLSEQFRAGTVTKRYGALVLGHPDWEEIEADGPIAADPRRSGAFHVSPRGRPALTHFRVLSRQARAGLSIARVEATPKTGRTHQIRVHAAGLGHPLLGDTRYGGPAQLTGNDGTRLECTRVGLHAMELSFDHPARGRLTVQAPWPADLSGWEQALETGPKPP